MLATCPMVRQRNLGLVSSPSIVRLRRLNAKGVLGEKVGDKGGWKVWMNA